MKIKIIEKVSLKFLSLFVITGPGIQPGQWGPGVAATPQQTK